MTEIIDNGGYKEVYFHEYCPKCKYALSNPYMEPCDRCLDEPTNLYSHKPINFEEKEK